MSAERRQAVRIRCLLPVQLSVQGSRRMVSTLTKDLSIRGARLLSPHQLDHNTHLALDLLLDAELPLLHLQGLSVWNQPVGQGEQFLVGVSFQNVPEKYTRLLSGYIESKKEYLA